MEGRGGEEKMKGMIGEEGRSKGDKKEEGEGWEEN